MNIIEAGFKLEKIVKQFYFKFFSRDEKLSQSGFSLLDISLYLFLLGLLLILVFPQLKSRVADQIVDVGARRLQQDLQVIRNYAIQSGQMKKIVFERDSSIYHVYRQEKNLWVLDQSMYQLHKDLIITDSNLSNFQIVFDIKGVPYEDPIDDLPLDSTDDKLNVERYIVISDGIESAKVIIVPDTGYIDIE